MPALYQHLIALPRFARTVAAFALSVMAWTPDVFAASVSPAQLLPGDVIKALYGVYGVGSDGFQGSVKEDAAHNSLFSASLLALYNKDIQGGTAEVDFFVQGQDFDLSQPIIVTKVSQTENKALVYATLKQNWINGPRTDYFVFVLVKQGGAWKIDDGYNNAVSLRDWLTNEINDGSPKK